jgi:hypothetical protein
MILTPIFLSVIGKNWRMIPFGETTLVEALRGVS